MSAESLPVEVSSDKLLIGAQAAAHLRVQFQPQEGETLRSYASVGELRAIPSSSPRTEEFVYRPPSSGPPTIAVLIFWVDAQLPERFTVLRLPLYGRTDLRVVTESRARVQIRVGDKLFGPVKAGADGAAQVPVEVPPGVRSAVALAEFDGRKTERIVPLPTPPIEPLASVLTPSPVHPGQSAIWAVAHSGPLTGKVLEVSAVGASAVLIDRDRDRAIYLVKPEEGAAQIQLMAQMVGQEEVTTSLEAKVVWTESPRVDPTPVCSQPGVGSVIPFAQLGLFFAGEANLGPALAGGVSVPLPLLERRLSAEVELGIRTAGVGLDVPGISPINSRLWTVPISVGGRLRALQRGRVGLDVRAGLGALFFHHAVWADFQKNYSEQGLGMNGFLSLVSSLRTQSFEPFVELRMGYSPANTDRLRANVGGISLSLGGRFVGP